MGNSSSNGKITYRRTLGDSSPRRGRGAASKNPETTLLTGNVPRGSSERGQHGEVDWGDAGTKGEKMQMRKKMRDVFKSKLRWL